MRVLLRPTAVILFAFVPPASASVPDASQFRRPECADRSSDKFFFPEGLLGDKTAQFDQDEFTRRWYSMPLRTMSEPSLSCDRPPPETYRFLMLRSFDVPMFVRVESRDGGAVLRAGVMSFSGGRVARSIQRNLTQAELTQVTDRLGSIGFWKLTTRVVPEYGRDGEHWVIEGRRGSQYHLVDRWSPKDGPYRDVCLALLKLAGLDPTFGKHHY